jgi:hypothetical protein
MGRRIAAPKMVRAIPPSDRSVPYNISFDPKLRSLPVLFEKAKQRSFKDEAESMLNSIST